MAWGIDLGTTNTGLARWDTKDRRAVLVELPGVCRLPGSQDILSAPQMVPSAVHILEPDFWTRVGRWPVVRDLTFMGREALIGRQALDANEAWPHPEFVPTFKAQLSRDPARHLARMGTRMYSARDVARMFFRELMVETYKATGERIRDLVITVPIASYDGYRAELREMATQAGIRKIRFLDEPVAAAVGYGISIDRPKNVLVLDIGGGTAHVVYAQLTPRGAEGGACEVLGKEGRRVGGNLVDRWLLEAVCAELGIRLDDAPADEMEGLWQRLMLAEARRVKESLHFREVETFTLTAPEELRGVRARLGAHHSLKLTREFLVAVLEKRGFYALLDEMLESALGEKSKAVDEVLMVGGSTLLPGVYPKFEQLFGRDRVRGWQPFESVVTGAAIYAGGGWTQSDFIVHDYALLTHDPKTQEPQYTVVIPHGTRFPTAPDFWKRSLVPTCALGEPERLFKLIVYEMGRNDDSVKYGWDASGNLRPLGNAGSHDLVVALNAANPTLGTLDPPHPPSDRAPRLEVSFGVNADRWLIATVRDLKGRKLLMHDEPVVRLL